MVNRKSEQVKSANSSTRLLYQADSLVVLDAAKTMGTEEQTTKNGPKAVFH